MAADRACAFVRSLTATGGETGRLIAALDWSATPLGALGTWTQSLRTALGLLLRSPVPMVLLWGEDGVMLYNDAYSRFAGGRHPRLLGAKVRDGWPEVAAFNDRVMRVGLAGGTLSFRDQELTLRRHGRPEPVWMNLDYSPVPDEAGQPAGVICVLAETTERVAAERDRTAAEAALRAERDRAHGVLDNMDEAFVLLDRDLRILDMNAEATRLERRPREAILGLTHWDAHPDAAPELGELYRRALAERRSGTLEHRYVWPDGRDTWIAMRAYPVGEGLAVFYKDVTAGKRTELALADRERELRTLADALPVLVSHVDAERRYRFVNRVYEDWFPRRREEILGRPVREVVGEAAYGGIAAHMDAALRGEHQRFEQRMPYADAPARVVELEYIPRKDAAGRPDGFYALVRDVSAEKAAQQALEDAQRAAAAEAAERSAILAQLAEGVIVADPAGRITFVNEAASRIHGVSRLDVEPAQYAEAYSLLTEEGEPYPPGRLPLARAVLAGETVNEARWRIRRPDGSEVLAVGSARPVADAGGRRIGAVLTLRDETARDAAERLSKTSEARLRELNATLEERVEQRTAERNRIWAMSRDLFAIMGFDGHLKAINPAWEATLGFDEATLLARPLAEQVHPEDLVAAGSVLERLRRGEPVPRFEDRLRHADGSWRWIAWALVPHGDVFYAVGRDVSAEKEAAAELEQAQAALRHAQKMDAMGQLTGGVAHDFNNLLTPIIGSLDRLASRGVGSEREQRLIRGALESAERAKTLVQRLLAFARRQPLQPVAVDVGALVDGMAGLINSTLGPKIDVTVDLAPDLPPARADANQLEMALLNLAVNARDAMPDGGRLTIAAERASLGGQHRSGLKRGHYVLLSVADTGIGMDEATLARAVEPFFSTKGVGRGTGLGLSMAHGLAAQLGGALTIESRPGQGTRVELWLPISTEAAEEADAGRAVPPIRASRGRALLVDDEQLVRMSTADMLADLGYEVLEAGSAEEALRLLREGTHLDLLVTDHLMPGMSGADLAREARTLRPDLRTLIVSGYAEVDGIAPDLPRLAKPFRVAELADRLAGLVSSPALAS